MSNLHRLSNPITFMIPKGLLDARRYVHDRLSDYTRALTTSEDAIGKADRSRYGSLLPSIYHMCRKVNVSDSLKDHQVLLISGLLPNATAVLIWMMHHLIADPVLLSKVRAEIDHFIRDSNAGKPEGSIDLAAAELHCSDLMATWYEVLRFHGNFSHARFVHDDTVVADENVLKKDSIILAPQRLYHFDREVWGPDAGQFRPERFLFEDGGVNHRLAKSIHVFGLFGALCPGRYLALHALISMVIKILVTFEIRHATETELKMPKNSSFAAIGVGLPDGDVEVILRRNANYGPIKILYDNIGTSNWRPGLDLEGLGAVYCRDCVLIGGFVVLCKVMHYSEESLVDI
jgi:cytochrome P450